MQLIFFNGFILKFVKCTSHSVRFKFFIDINCNLFDIFKLRVRIVERLLRIIELWYFFRVGFIQFTIEKRMSRMINPESTHGYPILIINMCDRVFECYATNESDNEKRKKIFRQLIIRKTL